MQVVFPAPADVGHQYGHGKAEHLSARDCEGQIIDGKRRPEALGYTLNAHGGRAAAPIARHSVGHDMACSGITASTGIPCLSTPSWLGTDTRTRYTSFDRSSEVCTLRGVNSAFGEM